MPFTPPPDYEGERANLTDFVNTYVVIEPLERGETTTRFKDDDGNPKIAQYWSTIVWTVSDNGDMLVPHTGINVFSKPLRDALDVAYRAGNPVAGRLVAGKGQRKVELTPGTPDKMAELEKLWDTSQHLPPPPVTRSTPVATAADDAEDEEPF